MSAHGASNVKIKKFYPPVKLMYVRISLTFRIFICTLNFISVEFFELYMQADARFVKIKQYTPTKVSVRLHSDCQKVERASNK